MNLEKARESYMNDPQYHHLVDVLVNQIEMLELTPCEIRAAAVFACIIIEERRMHPLVMLDSKEMQDILIGSIGEEAYRKYVLGNWDPVPAVKAEKKKVLVCKKCLEAIMPGGDGICPPCKAKEANQQ